jgi:NTE family protein
MSTVVRLPEAAPALPRPLALVLSGGASLGAVQVGMAASLEHFRIRPDLIVGTSVGALNGALLAAEPRTAVAQLAAVWRRLRRTDVFPLQAGSVLGALLGRSRHLVPAAPLKDVIDGLLPVRDFAELAVPFTAVATEELSGHRVALASGDLASALLASTAIPGVFPPVQRDGRSLVDGGMSANVPIDVAASLGARSIVVADTAAPCHLSVPPATVPEVLVHALGRLTRLQVGAQVEAVQRNRLIVYLPTPCTTRRSPLDFTGTAQLITAAETTTDAFLRGLADRPIPQVGLLGAPHRHDTDDEALPDQRIVLR